MCPLLLVLVEISSFSEPAAKVTVESDAQFANTLFTVVVAPFVIRPSLVTDPGKVTVFRPVLRNAPSSRCSILYTDDVSPPSDVCVY